MNKDAFRQYLLSTPLVGNKPLSKSTAKERVDCCKTIEKTLFVDLDIVASDPAQRAEVLKKVSAMTRSNVATFERSARLYFDFADAFSDTQRYIPMDGRHFYHLAGHTPPAVYFDLIPALKNEYECILGYGWKLLDLQHKCSDIERIPVIFSPLIKKKTYKADKNYWSQKICELARKKEGAVTKAEILRILEEKKFTHTIMGEFCPGYNQFGPHIILYYNVMGGETPEEKLAIIANCLAHEFMHYLEFRYCSANAVTYYDCEALSEAMADFFAGLYSIHSNDPEAFKVAFSRYEAWEKRFGSSWPYAQALYFYTVGGKTMPYSDHYGDYETHGSVQKLVSVFSQCICAEAAYDTLVSE